MNKATVKQSTMRQRYADEYRRARVQFRAFSTFDRDNTIDRDALRSLWEYKRGYDRLKEFMTLWRDPRRRAWLASPPLRVHGASYPAAARFPAPVFVTRAPCALSLTGEIYRAFDRLQDGRLVALNVSAETPAALKNQLQLYAIRRRPALIFV